MIVILVILSSLSGIESELEITTWNYMKTELKKNSPQKLRKIDLKNRNIRYFQKKCMTQNMASLALPTYPHALQTEIVRQTNTDK